MERETECCLDGVRVADNWRDIYTVPQSECPQGIVYFGPDFPESGVESARHFIRGVLEGGESGTFLSRGQGDCFMLFRLGPAPQGQREVCKGSWYGHLGDFCPVIERRKEAVVVSIGVGKGCQRTVCPVGNSEVIFERTFLRDSRNDDRGGNFVRIIASCRGCSFLGPWKASKTKPFL